MIKTYFDYYKFLKTPHINAFHFILFFFLIITQLSSKTINSTDAVNNMNKILRDSGFQGFIIKSNLAVPHTYMVVRDNDAIATNLSEGEQNFIAFLYFYQLVLGNDSGDGNIKDKIVVIDDPVSSMDSSTLFIVGALTREMIEICRNNAASQPGIRNYIKQIFILTHNTYYHHDIAANMVKYWDAVAYFKITKTDNRSTIIPCIEESKDFNGNMLECRNINPVQNGYNALWLELREVTSPVAVTHVIHQILNHYFIQMCSYDGVIVRDRILVENKDKFLMDDGSGNYKPEFHHVRSLLSYLAVAERGISDGQQFIDSAIDATSCKQALKSIFEIMGQDQHYKMMMMGE